MPLFKRGEVSSREKVEQLEDYMLLTAFQQGQLAEERTDLEEQIADKLERWNAIQTSSVIMGKKATEAQLERERWEDEPDLGRELKGLQRRIRHLSEEEARMERDAKVCSRAYSMITGT